VTGLDADDVVTLPNSLLTLGIADVAGYSSLVPRDNRELVNRINSYQNLDRNPLMPRIRNPASPLLDLAGVEYLLSRNPVPTTGWELVAADDSTFLHRNREVAPRAFVVGTVRVLNRKATWRALKAGDFHACQFATVLEGGPALPAAHRPGCVGEAQIVEYEPNRVAVRAEAWEDGLLVLTDSYHPGWRARVDGEERPVYSADGAFRGVWLTAGVHQVEFAFRPRSLMLGAFVSLAGLAAALMNIVARRT
jgi:hypothetical protein